MPQDRFEILTQRAAVLPFVTNVQKIADANTDALGFFHAQFYAQLAHRGQLFVAVSDPRGRPEYVGHLLFNCRFPRAHVLQMYCTESARRQSVSTRLLNILVEQLTQDGFMSIQARVAEDLVAANAFWSARGFYIQRTEPGRGRNPRQIVVRVLELESPQLFPKSGLADSAGNPLGLAPAVTTAQPLYLIDLNVIFDLATHRVRHELALALFSAANAGFCRIAISDEAREELTRAREQTSRDPVLELVGTLPHLAKPKGTGAESLFQQLAALVFPGQVPSTLNANRRSDLWHLATAINQRVTGFITSDRELLNASDRIVEQFGVEVLSPEVFQQGEADALEAIDVQITAQKQLTMRLAGSEDDDVVRALLMRYGLSAMVIAGHWIPFPGSVLAASRVAVLSGSDCVGYLNCSRVAGVSEGMIARAVVDDQHAEAPNAARLLFRALADALATGFAHHISLETPEHQSALRDEARRFGFSSASNTSALVKIAVGDVLTRANWRRVREELAKSTKLRLPESPPRFRSPSQLIPLLAPDGNQRQLPLDALETYLSPVLLCLPGRPAVIAPIEPRYAEPLLGHSPQGSLLPRGTAALHGERMYVSGPSTHRHLSPGTLMLFYESGPGAQAIVAVARVTQSFLQEKTAIPSHQLERSVLTPQALDQIGSTPVRTVSMIDNIFPLRHGVPLARLRELECGAAHQLITTQPVGDQQLERILLEGFKA